MSVSNTKTNEYWIDPYKEQVWQVEAHGLTHVIEYSSYLKIKNQYENYVSLSEAAANNRNEVILQLIKIADQALRQWKMYVEDYNQEDLDEILKNESDNIEAQELNRCINALDNIRIGK